MSRWMFVIAAVLLIAWMVIWVFALTGSWIAAGAELCLTGALFLFGRALGHADYSGVLLREARRIRAARSERAES